MTHKKSVVFPLQFCKRFGKSVPAAPALLKVPAHSQANTVPNSVSGESTWVCACVRRRRAHTSTPSARLRQPSVPVQMWDWLPRWGAMGQQQSSDETDSGTVWELDDDGSAPRTMQDQLDMQVSAG